jgi:hypothetical protein
MDPSEALPSSYRDAWDSHHVRLPCSPQNTCFDPRNPQKKLWKWNLIQTALTSESISSFDKLKVCVYVLIFSIHFHFHPSIKKIIFFRMLSLLMEETMLHDGF